MAGRGPAPKDASQRRRRNAPARGEWTDLPAKVEKATLPALPRRARGDGEWHSRTKALWVAWRKDPATLIFGPAEIAGCVELAFLHHESMATGEPKPAELRLRMDGLGLTAKGKRDLRLRVVADELEARRPSPSARRRLRIVDPELAKASR